MSQPLRRLLACSCILIVSGTLQAAVTFNASNQVTEISGLSVAGHGTFDVSFDYGLTFEEKFGVSDPPNIMTPQFWQDGAGALAAADAIRAELISEGVFPAAIYQVAVPYQLFPDGAGIFESQNVQAGTTEFLQFGNLHFVDSLPSSFPLGLAMFTPAPVPEASTVISWCLMVVTGVGLAWFRKRKR